ncbi:MAG: hypothetical protein IJR63_08905 [Synergistaceae bacterium]|nr:hypothetical protein [Synergistaceae bacterium]
MKKLALLSLLIVILAVFSPESYAVVPGGCVPEPDYDTLRWAAGVIWGTAKGCWSAYFAPEGERLDAFTEAFKDGFADCTSQREAPYSK